MQVLDRLQAGIASAGGDINNTEAVEKKDMTMFNTLIYSHPIEHFCDGLSELKRMSRVRDLWILFQTSSQNP